MSPSQSSVLCVEVGPASFEIPIGSDVSPKAESDREYLDLIREFVNNGSFHFSYTRDITSMTLFCYLFSYYHCTHQLVGLPFCTESCESLFHVSSERALPSQLSTADSRFFWNAQLLQGLMRQGEMFAPFIMPIVDAFVQLERPISLGGGDILCKSMCKMESNDWRLKVFVALLVATGLSLVSRRGCKRAGMRYHCRGVDGEGNVANYVESEQIIV